MSDWLKTSIRGIHTITLEPNDSFTSFCAPFAAERGTVILRSGGGFDCARYDILAARPWLEMRTCGKRTTLSGNDGVREFNQNPFSVLHDLLNRYQLAADPSLPTPIAAGLFGYFGYDLKNALETLPDPPPDNRRLPDLCLFAPSLIVVRNRSTGETRLHIPVREASNGDTLEGDLAAFERIRAKSTVSPAVDVDIPDTISSNFTCGSYEAAVEKVRGYIRSGDVYQVNLAQRFESNFAGDPYALFCRLFGSNPASFFAFVQAEDHQVLSTSPERLIKRVGHTVEARPIKGTRPRGATEPDDVRLREELAASAKDDAELSMIVDLMRNDIGKVCRAGSVRVTKHKRLESYENVHHLVSIVEGHLRENVNSADLIAAVFPAGSITGCPKIRAMEIIDELEHCRRHVYCGSLGYVGFDHNVDLSVAIRTATVANGRIYFSVGGGIVWDSDPADEYRETLHKGQTLIRALCNGDTNTCNRTD